MFVYRREDLPPDAEFPADLEQLGYFINDKDQIRNIANPDQDFKFKINRNERWNDVHREAMNTCIRTIVSARLKALGLTTLRLPLTSKPSDPHVPIWVSANLSKAKRIIVVFGEPIQDLGIWAYRTIGSEGINAGSAVSLAKVILYDKNNNNKDTALILANTGQSIWHCGIGKAVTHPSWLAQPRKSAVDPVAKMTARNKIPRNKNWQEHVDCVFEEILSARGRLVREDASIDIIGLAEGGLGAIRYLSNDWPTWQPYISAICLSNPLQYTHIEEDHLHPQDSDPGSGSDPGSPSSFASFISARCRAYVLSNVDLGLPVAGFREHGCNCYSSGEELNIEGIMPRAWSSMLEWLGLVHGDPEYAEEVLVVANVEELEMEAENRESEDKGE